MTESKFDTQLTNVELIEILSLAGEVVQTMLNGRSAQARIVATQLNERILEARDRLAGNLGDEIIYLDDVIPEFQKKYHKQIRKGQYSLRRRAKKQSRKKQ